MDKERTKLEQVQELIKELSAVEKDQLYRDLWYPYVVEDVEDRLDVLEIEPTETCVEQVATDIVYHGEYDCNLTYWDNVDKLINRYIWLKK